MGQMAALRMIRIPVSGLQQGVQGGARFGRSSFWGGSHDKHRRDSACHCVTHLCVDHGSAGLRAAIKALRGIRPVWMKAHFSINAFWVINHEIRLHFS